MRSLLGSGGGHRPNFHRSCVRTVRLCAPCLVRRPERRLWSDIPGMARLVIRVADTRWTECRYDAKAGGGLRRRRNAAPPWGAYYPGRPFRPASGRQSAKTRTLPGRGDLRRTARANPGAGARRLPAALWGTNREWPCSAPVRFPSPTPGSGGFRKVSRTER